MQELRGNIRIFVRVRPFLPGDAVLAAAAAEGGGGGGGGALADAPPVSAISCSADGTVVSIQPPAPRAGAKEAISKRDTKPLDFTFDAVFPPAAGQADVFGEVSHLVQSALDGYQVCLFSYGQTGSGKTHTMQGARGGEGGGLGAGAGLIPRSVRQILEAARRMEAQGWAYAIEVSFLEVRGSSAIP